jgi:hypothetical protein
MVGLIKKKGDKMEKRIFVKIGKNQIKFREPYFLECCWCGLVISGRSIEEVEKEANQRGWKYDYKHDVVFCSDCVKEVVKIEEKIKKIEIK